MRSITRWLTALGVLLAGWLVVTAPTLGQPPNRRPVPLGGIDDAAGLFSQTAVRKAREEIQEIKTRTG